MDRPQNLVIPTLFAKNSALILWDKVFNAGTYQLQRKLDVDESFILIYNGIDNFFNDFIPLDAVTATYRVQAISQNVKTWDELDALNRTWDYLDALDWTWWDSDWTESETKEVVPNRAPIISDQDKDLGTKYRGFDVTFSATDPDPNSTIDLMVHLNDKFIFNMPSAQQGVNYTAIVTDEQVFAMEDNSRHTITITAIDNHGEISTRIQTFIAVEDVVTTAVFYILRDGQPIAKIRNIWQWTDFMEIGTHRYIVRGVDRYGNFSDSNEVTVTITLRHAVLGLVSNPSNFINLIWRLDGSPTMGRDFNTNFSETWYEGRTFPVYENSGQKSNSVPLAFSTLNLQDQQNLFSLISQGTAVIYRDQYDSRVVGVIPNFSNEFQGRYKGQTHNALINFNLTLNQADFNEVIEYD